MLIPSSGLDIRTVFDFPRPFAGVPPLTVSISSRSALLPLRGYQSRYKLHINLSGYPFQAVAGRFLSTLQNTGAALWAERYSALGSHE